jgi:hypothetical protein
MGNNLADAVLKTGTIAVAYFFAWSYHGQSHGDLLFSRRVLQGAGLLLLAFALALGWQTRSNAKRC